MHSAERQPEANGNSRGRIISDSSGEMRKGQVDRGASGEENIVKNSFEGTVSPRAYK